MITRSPVHQRGFTLIEISIALLIGLFLIGGLLTMLQGNRRAFTGQSQMAELQDNERLAMTMISDVIQTAGYFPNPVGNTAIGLLTLDAPIAAGQALYGAANATPALGDTLTVRFATLSGDNILNCNGVSNTAAPGVTALYKNVFSVVTTDATTTPQKRSLYCKVNNNAALELVPGLEKMEVLYGVKRNTAVNNNSADTYLPVAQMVAADWTNVIAIKVKLTFQNPLYVAGQVIPAQFIVFERVVSVMNQTGVKL